MGKKFNHLNIPSHWEHYWTRYPEGYTILEALLNWVGQVDNMIDNVNEWNEYLDDFVATFDKNLQGKVTSILSEWQDSGFLDVVIDEALQTQMDVLEQETHEKLNQFSAELESLHINVKYPPSPLQPLIGDNSFDNTTRLQAIANYAKSISNVSNIIPILYFPHALGYRISDTCVIPRGISVEMDAPIVYSGTSNKPALIVGDLDNREVNERVSLDLWVINNQISDWEDENNIGIQLVNTTTSRIDIREASGFTIGLQCIGRGRSFSYNDVYLGRLINNKIAVDLTNENFNGTGWCNENTFYNGRFTNTTTTHTTKSRYGVRVTSKDGLYVVNNNNNFIKPSFELKVPTSGEAVPILIEHGEQNKFQDCRNEDNSATFIRTLNLSQNNEVEIGYGFLGRNTVQDLGTRPSTVIKNRREKIVNEAGHKIFDSGAIHKTACISNGTDSIHIPKIHVATSSNANISYRGTNITIHDNYLELGAGRGIGVMVDTRENKTFIVRKDTERGFGGRVSVRCYDENGNILTNTHPNHPYARIPISSHGTLSWDSSYGGVYSSGSDRDGDTIIRVHEDVKCIALLITRGTTNVRIRGFSVYIPNTFSECGHSAVWSGYEEIIEGANLGTSHPTTGTWPLGKIIWNAEPSIGSPIGWRKVTTGSSNVLGTDWEAI